MAETKRPTRSGVAVVAALLLITAAMLWKMIEFSLAPTYGYDELWHVYLGSIAPTWKFMLAVAGDSHPPAYYVMLRPFLALGHEHVYPRLLSAIPTALTLPLLYMLLRRLQIGALAALTTVAVLALSINALHLGVTVRSYALTALMLLAAAWLWTTLLPGSRRGPSRTTTVLSLALFTLAFATLYAAAFVTTAVFAGTLLVMLLNPSTGRQIRSNLRQFSGWPEWLLLVAGHLGIAFWFFLGWIRHISLQTPNHLSAYGRLPDQSVVEFLLTGLRREIALFTPLEAFSVTIQDAGLIALLLLIAWLVFDNLRRGNAARAVIALSPLLITIILALVGMLNKYPFGGAMRHQYILFPFLLMLLPLTLESIHAHLPHRLINIALALVALGIAGANAVNMHEHRLIGEAPNRSQFAREFKQLFATAPDSPILIPNFALFPAWVDRMPHGIHYQTSYQGGRDAMYVSYQGLMAPFITWPAYESYRYTADDGSQATLIKDHYRWDLPPVPTEHFFINLAQLLHRLDQTAMTVFAFQTGQRYQPDEAGLRAAAAANGFELTDFSIIGDAAIWRVERTAAALARPVPSWRQAAAAPADD